MTAAVAVIAKAPVAGRSKTRLCPPCTPDEAAAIAEAALIDTLRCVTEMTGRRRILVLDGPPGPWLPSGFEVIPQRGSGLDERLAAAFEDIGSGAVLIGMDTPQVSAELLHDGLERLDRGADTVLGPADDGGYWAIGLRIPRRDAFVDVPMSTGHTGIAQRRRLEHLGLAVELLPPLRDVDHFDDALAVAAAAPGTVFARAVAAVHARLPRTAPS